MNLCASYITNLYYVEYQLKKNNEKCKTINKKNVKVNPCLLRFEFYILHFAFFFKLSVLMLEFFHSRRLCDKQQGQENIKRIWRTFAQIEKRSENQSERAKFPV